MAIAAFALMCPARTAAQVAPRPPGPWVIDLRGATIGVPQAAAFYPPLTFYTLLAVLGWCLWPADEGLGSWCRSSPPRIHQPTRFAAVLPGLAAFALVAGAGLALAAAQVLPTLELLKNSPRGGAGGYEYVTNVSLPLKHLVTLVLPLSILGFTAFAMANPDALASRWNPGAHGLSEILYAYTSATGNNGSAFAGISANTPYFNPTLGFAMLIGRFLMIVPIMALAGSLGLAGAARLEVRVQSGDWDELLAADEAFLTNSLVGIWPLARLGERRWAAPGPVTRELMERLAHPRWVAA